MVREAPAGGFFFFLGSRPSPFHVACLGFAFEPQPLPCALLARSDPDRHGQGLFGAGCQQVGAKCNFIHQHQFAADACETSSEIWEQMRFRLAVNEAVLPSLSPVELTPLLWQSC